MKLPEIDTFPGVRQIDLVTRGPARPVGDHAIADGGRERATLEIVADVRVVRIIVREHERRHRTDVEVVRIAVTRAVVRELRMVDRHGPTGDRIAQDTVLVVDG